MHVHGDHSASSCFAESHDERIALGNEDGAAFNGWKVTVGSAVKQPPIQDFSRIMVGTERTHRCRVQFVETRGICRMRLANLEAGWPHGISDAV